MYFLARRLQQLAIIWPWTFLLTGWAKLTYKGVDFSGSDISSEVVNCAEHCQEKCTENPNCQFFTYHNGSFFHPSHRYELIISTFFKIFLVRKCVETWMIHWNHANSTVSNVYITWQQQWNVMFLCYRHRCYMKRVITMPAPSKVKKLANVVSGFTLRNCRRAEKSQD